MRECILKQNNLEIGDYFFCTLCKCFMLSTAAAEEHKNCTERQFSTNEPKEKLYRCSTCGRYFHEYDQWLSHDKTHKTIGNHDPTRFVLRFDQNNRVMD